MDDELKTRIERAIGYEQANTGESTTFAGWMRDAAREKLARENAESSGSQPEEGVA